MKKQLESELISIAHKILKLAGREDLGKMEVEISTLYQKVTILKFLEDNLLEPIPSTKDLGRSFFDSLKPADTGAEKIMASNQKKSGPERTVSSPAEKPKVEVADKELDSTVSETTQKEEKLEQNNNNLFSETQEHDLNTLSPSYSQLPIFEAKQVALKKSSLNDTLKPQGFQIGLNDRLAFVKGLFENNNEDYDRVLSQLSTLDSYTDAINLLNTVIKPDYNNWKDQEELEARFLEVIQGKFN